MDMVNYLENMGITVCQRAFFSYMAKPQGSYGLHMIFRLFLKKKRIIMLERDRASWCRFLADYAVFRLYIARYVLKDFARDYPPLLSIYTGFDKVEEDFPNFLKKEADPGRGVGDLSLLPDNLPYYYSEEKIKAAHELFDHMADKAELKMDSPDAALKSFIEEALSYLCTKDKAPLYTPVFWFFSKETLAYAQYLAELYKGLIPESHYETLHARPYKEVEREEDTFYTDYRLPAYILFFVAGLICVVLAKA